MHRYMYLCAVNNVIEIQCHPGDNRILKNLRNIKILVITDTPIPIYSHV